MKYGKASIYYATCCLCDIRLILCAVTLTVLRNTFQIQVQITLFLPTVT